MRYEVIIVEDSFGAEMAGKPPGPSKQVVHKEYVEADSADDAEEAVINGNTDPYSSIISATARPCEDDADERQYTQEDVIYSAEVLKTVKRYKCICSLAKAGRLVEFLTVNNLLDKVDVDKFNGIVDSFIHYFEQKSEADKKDDKE